MATTFTIALVSDEIQVDGSLNVKNLVENTTYTVSASTPFRLASGAAGTLSGGTTSIVDADTYYNGTVTLATSAVNVDTFVEVIASSGATANILKVQADAISIFIGSEGFQPKNILENGAGDLDPVPAFADIEYTVTTELPGSNLIDLLSNVAIAVSKADFVDFDQTNEARVDNVKTYQKVQGRSLDFDILDSIGDNNATLTGNFYDSTGSDAVDVDGVLYPIDMAGQMKLGSALPKALGSQMALTSGKDDVFRVMIAESDFADLIKFSIKGEGCEDFAGNAGVTLQSLIRSVESLEGDNLTYADVTDSATVAPGARKLGHEILSSLFRSDPCTAANTGDAADKVWKHENDDFLVLNKLPQDVILQFVLKTELNLIAGSQTISTHKSPAVSTPFDVDPAVLGNRVLILYNFKFTA